MSGEVRRLLRELRQAGLEVSQARSGHYLVECPGGRVSIAGTPSDRRTTLNDRARLRRKGAPI